MRRWLPRAGASLFAAAGASASLVSVAPSVAASTLVNATVGVVTVQAVPALPGVRFSIDGLTGVTGADGSAVLSDRQLNTAAQHLVVPEQQLTSNLRVSLERVVNVPDHPLFHRFLLVNLDEDRAVNFVIDTPEGAALPSGQVSSMTLQDSLGRTLQFTGKDLAGSVWLASRRPSPDPTGVAARNVVYTVASVMVHGSDIVSAGRLHFEPDQTTSWKIPGIFFSLTVQGDDLLGGKPAGSSLRLVYPDHSVVQVPLDSHHRARLTDLPRGNYSIRVGGGLIGLTSQVRLSRDQVVTQVVLTTGDALLIALGAVGIVGGLAATGMIGRHLRRTRRRRMELSGVPA